MKKTNIALFVIAGIIAIANLMQGQTITQDTSFYRNNTVMQVNTYLDGVKIERCVYYPTGELQLYQEFDPATGLQTNDEFWYFRNGEVQHACGWVNNFAHGWAFTWDESGELISSEVYVENRLVPTEDYAKYFPDRVVESDDVFTAGFAARR
jgi:antitoxin component YwqK of YwqJK toxin-antitoxin module